MPIYRMPLRPIHTAAVREIDDALCAARCAAQLAGDATDDFVIRELLLAVIHEIDRAADHVHRLHVSA